MYKRFAEIITKVEKPCSQIMGWVRAMISFSIVRATDLCLRGSWVKWRSGVGMEDGAGIPSF